MALFVKDVEVDRKALRHELERYADHPNLVDLGVAFTRALRERAGKKRGIADKPFIDELYGEP
jgi:hypothetical protein